MTPEQTLSDKQKALAGAAKVLMCQFGLKRITVEEICKTAGISKMTFYKYFSNKNDIATDVINMLYDEGMELFNDIINADTTFPEKVEKILKLKLQRLQAIGEAFLNDIIATDSPLNSHFLKLQEKSKEITIKFLKEAQEAGDVRKDLKMPFLLFMMNHLYDLIMSPDFSRIMPDIEDRIYEISVWFFYGIMKRN